MDSKRLKLFSDRAFLPTGVPHVHMLYPFWGKNPEVPGAPYSGRFDRYTEIGKEFFEMTSLDQADLAVLPIPWERAIENPVAKEQAFRFARFAAEKGKKVLIFFWCDLEWEVPIPNALVLRSTIHRGTRNPNEFMMPEWSEDVTAKYLGGRLPIRERSSVPTVGFMGFPGRRRVAGRDQLRYLLSWGAGHLGLRPKLRRNPFAISGHVARARALYFLERTTRIRRNFVIRNGFVAGTIRPDGTTDQARQIEVRRDFVDNLVNSDYALCTQGAFAGGFSYRIYEVLSCGRIPVFVDTDSTVPYDFTLNWKDFGVWVNQADLPRIGDVIADFHQRLSPDEFVAMQHRCRKLWEDWLSPEGYFRNLHLHLGRLHA